MSRIAGILGSAVAVCAFPLGAHAADLIDTYAAQQMAPAGWYVSMHGGAAWLSDVDSSIPSDGNTSTLDYDMGFRVGGAIGYHFNENFAMEAEVSYAEVEPNKLTLFNVVPTTNEPEIGEIWSSPASGQADVLTLMGNFIASTQVGNLNPYIGAGAGVGWVHSLTNSFDVDRNVPLSFEDDATVWAAQVFGGADYALTDKLSIGGRYRAQWIGSWDILNFIETETSLWHSAEVTLKYKLY